MFLVNQSSLGYALTCWETRALAACLGSSGKEVAPLRRKWLRPSSFVTLSSKAISISVLKQSSLGQLLNRISGYSLTL
jgi:hypothetical protein